MLFRQEDKYEKLTTSTKSEITRLEAALKMKEMQIQGLESTLEQKVKPFFFLAIKFSCN